MNKLWGYLQSSNPLIGYGNALHFCLRHAAELIKDKGLDPISAVATAVDEVFHLPFAGMELSEKVKSKAKQTLVNFAVKHETDMRNIEEVESRLEFPLQNATIVGKVDVILKDDKSFEIRDYKTSDNIITQEHSELQLRLYTYGLKNIDWDISKGSVAYLEAPTIEEVTLHNNEINNAKNDAERIVNLIKNSRYKPNSSDFCGKCEYFNICKYGREKNG